jgi:hypothetical protein
MVPWGGGGAFRNRYLYYTLTGGIIMTVFLKTAITVHGSCKIFVSKFA